MRYFWLDLYVTDRFCYVIASAICFSYNYFQSKLAVYLSSGLLIFVYTAGVQLTKQNLNGHALLCIL